jgi:hypothetical protein
MVASTQRIGIVRTAVLNADGPGKQLGYCPLQKWWARVLLNPPVV